MSRLNGEEACKVLLKEYNKLYDDDIFEKILRVSCGFVYLDDNEIHKSGDKTILEWLFDIFEISIFDQERKHQIEEYSRIIKEKYGIENINQLSNHNPESMTTRDLQMDGIKSMRDCMIINNNHENLYNSMVVYKKIIICVYTKDENNIYFKKEKELFEEHMNEHITKRLNIPIEVRTTKYFESHEL